MKKRISNIIYDLKFRLAKKILGGELPKTPQYYLWKLIDKENSKEDPNDIRCDYIDAWLYAIEHIKEL